MKKLISKERKKGFTLIELLAVIIILGVLMLIAIPNVTEYINASRKKVYLATAKQYASALSTKINSLEYVFTNSEIAYYVPSNCIPMERGGRSPYGNWEYAYVIVTFDGKNYKYYWTSKDEAGYGIILTRVDELTVNDIKTNFNILSPITGDQVEIDGKNYTVGISSEESCGTINENIIPEETYIESKGVNAPMLIEGLTAVKWNTATSTWDIVDDPNNDTSWYDYSNKEWANATSVDGSSWVWIPRYAYQIPSKYHLGGSSTYETINVKFLKNRTNTASDNTTVDTVPTYNESSQTNYIVHPAFKFGDNEITGMWVAKFEPTSSEGIASSGTTCNAADNVSTNTVKIIPNATSWRCITIDNAFNATLNMKNNSSYGWTASQVNTHIMKNTEWGAIAYLTQSIYGKNSEVWKNPSTIYKTGCVGSSVSASATSCGNEYSKPTAYNGSTTGTIYGIYDMSGGADEYTMAYLNSSALQTSGILSIQADTKYKDIYPIGLGASQANNHGASKIVVGSAIYETSSLGTDPGYSWYGDNSSMLTATLYWFRRGGNYNTASPYAGIFAFTYGEGAARYDTTFRPILLVGRGL